MIGITSAYVALVSTTGPINHPRIVSPPGRPLGSPGLVHVMDSLCGVRLKRSPFELTVADLRHVHVPHLLLQAHVLRLGVRMQHTQVYTQVAQSWVQQNVVSSALSIHTLGLQMLAAQGGRGFHQPCLAWLPLPTSWGCFCQVLQTPHSLQHHQSQYTGRLRISVVLRRR